MNYSSFVLHLWEVRITLLVSDTGFKVSAAGKQREDERKKKADNHKQ